MEPLRQVLQGDILHIRRREAGMDQTIQRNEDEPASPYGKAVRIRRMIKKGDRIKGFRFDNDNSGAVRWDEWMYDYIGLEGTVTKIAEGPKGTGQRLQVRFQTLKNSRVHDGIQPLEIYPNFVTAMYPLAECLQLIREERLKEIGL